MLRLLCVVCLMGLQACGRALPQSPGDPVSQAPRSGRGGSLGPPLGGTGAGAPAVAPSGGVPPAAGGASATPPGSVPFPFPLPSNEICRIPLDCPGGCPRLEELSPLDCEHQRLEGRCGEYYFRALQGLFHTSVEFWSRASGEKVGRFRSEDTNLFCDYTLSTQIEGDVPDPATQCPLGPADLRCPCNDGTGPEADGGVEDAGFERDSAVEDAGGPATTCPAPSWRTE